MIGIANLGRGERVFHAMTYRILATACSARRGEVRYKILPWKYVPENRVIDFNLEYEEKRPKVIVSLKHNLSGCGRDDIQRRNKNGYATGCMQASHERVMDAISRFRVCSFILMLVIMHLHLVNIAFLEEYEC